MYKRQPSTPSFLLDFILFNIASDPWLLKPNLLINAWSSTSLNTLGFSFPYCFNGVTVPTSTNPKPNLNKGKIKIIGVGGVDSGKAAYDKFLLGADYVQLYTGMVFQGPNIAGMIKKDLKELLIRDGVKNFTEIVGNKTVS